jgi:ATP-dependent Zn protease
MVSQLLLEMDMLEGEGCGVVVMAATNTPQVRNPSSFELHFAQRGGA